MLGEGAEVLDSHDDMLHVRTLLDNYEGWLAEGYVVAAAARRGGGLARGAGVVAGRAA